MKGYDSYAHETGREAARIIYGPEGPYNKALTEGAINGFNHGRLVTPVLAEFHLNLAYGYKLFAIADTHSAQEGARGYLERLLRQTFREKANLEVVMIDFKISPDKTSASMHMLAKSNAALDPSFRLD